MIAAIEHHLKKQHAVPHFVRLIGEEDWAREKIESAFRDGEFYALGPKDMPLNYLTHFNAGGILSPGPKNSESKDRIVPIPNLDEDFATLTVRTASEIPQSEIYI